MEPPEKIIANLRSNLKELQGLGALVKKDSLEIVGIIDKKQIPSANEIQTCYKNLSAWLSKSADLHSDYVNHFEKPLPEKISELEASLDAEERRIREASVFGQAEKFLLFTAEDAALEKILREQQTKLKKLLKGKKRDDKLKAAIEPYAKFFKATRENDNVKKFSLSAELRDFFSDDLIWRGIFNNELTLATPAADKPFTPPKKEKELPPLELTPPPSKPTKPPEDSDFVKLLVRKRAFLTDENFDRWNEFFVTEKAEHPKPFSATYFKRDFKAFKNFDALKAVMAYIMAYGLLSVPYFCPTNMPFNLLISSLQALIAKGYVQKYLFDKCGSIFGFTRNFYEFLTTGEVKKLLPANHADFILEEKVFLDGNVQRSLTRIIYFCLHDIVASHENSFRQVRFAQQAFLATFDDHGKCDLFIGCFWDTADECDKFLDNLKSLLDSEKEIFRVFVAGLTLEQTEKLFGAFEDVLAKDFPKDAEGYFYVFDDDAFYRKDTGAQIAPEEIWSAPPPDTPDDSKPEDDSEDANDLEPEETPADNDDKDFLREVKGLLLKEKFYCATAYLKAQSMNSAEVEPLYRQAAFALNDPLLGEKYSAVAISALVQQNDSPFNERLIIAAALRAFFYNDVEFDYDVPALYDAIKTFKPFKENVALAQLIRAAKDFKVDNQKGAAYFVDNFVTGKQAAEDFAEVVSDAEIYFRQFFENEFRGETGYTTVKTKQKIFDSSGEFGTVFKLVKAPLEDYTATALSTVKKFLTEKFIRKGAALESTNLDRDKLTDWIESCWDEVKAKHNKNSMVGDRRSNLLSNLERAGEIMCAWIKCAENLSSGRMENRHQKIFAEMASASKEAYKKLGKNVKPDTLDMAGALVLAHTLKEISARLDGSFDEAERKYFYVDFLRGEYVILGEDYLPKLDLNISDGSGDNVAEQILKHAALKLPSIEERIEQIFKKHGDDFGSARLLDDYLKATTGESFIAAKKYPLEKCIISAAKDAAPKLEEFKGGVELAQIHGQLYNMSEDAQEKMLLLVGKCYDYAKASGNFGVFFRVKDFWEAQIKKNAAQFGQRLEEDLQRATDDFKKNGGNFEPTVLTESVEAIRKLLAVGNFAAARTLIAELRRGKPYRKPAAEDVTLSRFIENYGECYGKVQNISTSLKNLLAKQSSDKNKFYKARGELIESWLPNGMPDSAGGKEKYRERVETLLELLGFDTDSVTLSDEADSKSLTFEVKLKKSFQMMHTHPIAAFGSEAEVGKAGFRVTCLFGQFPQENLIDYFKKLDAGNTLILLDHALKLPERRRLARAMKSDRSLMHIFAVVDRVVMMYLIKNCSEQIRTKRINDTLMSLIMPFSRCQPYIWDPQKPLPPEMFIGRENAMYDVKNPDGVNIVYGGRQLGKSALLKMACRELDGNKNQRAIYVEIRNKNYKEAALHASRELSDAKFFVEPLETDDWDILTREIKRRLSSDAPNKISYFLLTLDEADKFIDSCEEVNYTPIEALSRIQQTDYNGSRFKFVIAGLRNIVRFERKRAQSDNRILPVLKSLTIKPFEFAEARKLLEVPLRCLGLQFSDDRLLFTIAETALYFPGIIQLFCEKLLLTLFEPNSTSYGENAPPYEINESHIKKILADEEFVRNIKDKIEITLRLDDDKYYYVIAQILAHLYHESLKVDGYSPADILSVAKNFDLIKDRYLPNDPAKVDALMTELCELNILRKNDSGKYLFARRRIFNYMGTREEVENELFALMEETTANG